MKEFSPFVFRRGEPVGMTQHRDEDLKHVMACDAGCQGEHYIYDDKLTLGQEFFRQGAAENSQDEYVEYDVEKEGYGHRMTRVPDDLHLYDPVAVHRYQYNCNYQRAKGNTLVTSTSLIHLKLSGIFDFRFAIFD